MKRLLLVLGCLCGLATTVHAQSAAGLPKQPSTSPLAQRPIDGPNPPTNPPTPPRFYCTTPVGNTAYERIATANRPQSTCAYVRVFFHFVRSSNGSGGQPTSVLNQVTGYLNSNFAPGSIYFQSIGSDNINDDVYMSNFGNTNSYNDVVKFNNLTNTNVVSNALNIYLLADNSGYQGGRANAIPGNALVVGGTILSQAIVPSPVLSHELGHCLGLFHTFETSFGQEPVNTYNPLCTQKGDLVCDTPPESPACAWQENASCQYIGTAVDDFGYPYAPDVTNIMNYVRPSCMDHFTAGQVARMMDAITSSSLLAPFVSTDPTNLAINGPNPLCPGTSASYTLLNQPTGPDFVWSSSNTNVATVNSSTGQVNPIAAGTFTLTATTNRSCGNYSVSRTIQVGVSGFSVTGSYTRVGYGGTPQPVQMGNTTNVPTGTYQVTLAANYYGNSLPVIFSPWTFGDSGAQGAYNTNNNQQGVFSLQLYGGVSINVTGQCGSYGSAYFRFFANSNSLVASPNPANETVTVAEQRASFPVGPGLTATRLDDPDLPKQDVTVQLLNLQGVLVRSQTGKLADIKLDVRDLPNGLYILRSGVGTELSSQRIQVQH